jgi:hypothetical protein
MHIFTILTISIIGSKICLNWLQDILILSIFFVCLLSEMRLIELQLGRSIEHRSIARTDKVGSWKDYYTDVESQR